MLIDNQKTFDEYISSAIAVQKATDFLNTGKSTRKLVKPPLVDRNIQFSNITMDNVDLSNSILNQNTFENVQFLNCKLNGSIIEDCKFINVTFKKCNFDGAIIKSSKGSSLGMGGELVMGSGVRSCIYHVLSTTSDIQKSSFIACSMNSLMIENHILYDVKFESCFMLGLYFNNCYARAQSFINSNLERIVIRESRFSDCNFWNCNLAYSFFHQTSTTCVYNRCHFRESYFRRGSNHTTDSYNDCYFSNTHTYTGDGQSPDIYNKIGNDSFFIGPEFPQAIEYELISKEQYLIFLGFFGRAHGEIKSLFEPASISTINHALNNISYTQLSQMFGNPSVQWGDSGKLKIIDTSKKKNRNILWDLYNPFPGTTMGRLYKSMTNGKSPNQDYTVAQKEAITSRTLSEFTVADILYGIYWISNKKFTKTHENQRLDE